MKTTPDAVASLAIKVADAALRSEPADTPAAREVTVTMYATKPGQRPTSMTIPLGAISDSLNKYLAPKQGYSTVWISMRNGRVASGSSAENKLRVEEAAFTLFSSDEKRGNSYRTSGYEDASVEKIAGLFEAFGAASATWRGPEVAELAKAASAVLALLMLPLATSLRDRSRSWLLYPASALLFIASFLFPFGVVFNDLIITGVR
jgi:hypothetical protein